MTSKSYLTTRLFSWITRQPIGGAYTGRLSFWLDGCSRSFRPWSVISPPAPSLPIGVMPSSSAAPARASHIWLSPLPVLSSATERAGASSTSSIWSIGSRQSTAMKAGTHCRLPHPSRLRGARRTRLSALRPGRRAAALPISSAGSTNGPRSSSPPISPSANGQPSSATPK